PQYYITYEKDESGGYIASAPAVSGCVVHGRTLKQAHQNIIIAIRECLEVINEFNKKTPKETIKPEAIKKLSFVRVPTHAKT
ncbi:type II toxin-antitoxin system HicB family antitoxin, partial [Patescibacteria group bacterium]